MSRTHTASGSEPANTEAIDPMLSEFYNLRSYAEAIRQQIEVTQGVITEFTLSKATLEEIKNREGKGETLIHIGAGNYIRTQLQDVKTVVVGIGAGVSIEKGLGEAIVEIDQRMKKAQEQLLSLQNQYFQITTRLEQLQGKIDGLYSQEQQSGQA
jgi:prefoldin alpha subunit